jgi:hypothetical protein
MARERGVNAAARAFFGEAFGFSRARGMISPEPVGHGSVALGVDATSSLPGTEHAMPPQQSTAQSCLRHAHRPVRRNRSVEPPHSPRTCGRRGPGQND